MDKEEFQDIITAQDDLIQALGVDIWIGMEPTFTRRFVENPEWLSEALGPEKLKHAYALLNEVYKRQPAGVVLHTLGRQYASENLPRWSIGYYQNRNNQSIWDGPPDPALIKNSKENVIANSNDVVSFWQALNNELQQSCWDSACFQAQDDLAHRILFRIDDDHVDVDIKKKPLLACASIHTYKIPLDGLQDELAANGDFLLSIGLHSTESPHHDGTSVVIELPAMPNVKSFVQLLSHIAQAAKQASLQSLVIQGFPPPVDDTVAWASITPDPAVIEINQAPADNAATFYKYCELFYACAEAEGLAPYRLYYNGVVSDSGGGGQFTLGGPSPLASPFFRYPQLLPNLIAYLNAHPALSYWFAPPSIGSSSQSPRTDEGLADSFSELSLAVAHLSTLKNPSPELIWRSLSPFLVDPSGNSHRSELNIEKLWNPYLPGRGCLGLVEFRAFSMSRSPECATAIAVLLRSLVAMLSQQNKVVALLHHGSLLHDKYALPFYLQQDFQTIFKDLEDSGLPLHDSIKALLIEEPVRQIGQTVFNGCQIELQQALEFWPLVGDVASQENGGSRLIDASTTRLQFTLRLTAENPLQLDGWNLSIDGYHIPLRQEQTAEGSIKVIGLRYRNFQPDIGLHPSIVARSGIVCLLSHPDLHQALQVTYHEWHPEGLAYAGLPENIAEAKQRCQERFTTQVISVKSNHIAKTLPEYAATDYCLDLRRLAAETNHT